MLFFFPADEKYWKVDSVIFFSKDEVKDLYSKIKKYSS